MKTLTKTFDTTVAAVGKQVLAFPWQDRNAYALWLAQTFFLVRHTSTLISILAGKVGVHDPLRHREMLSHLREETGHEMFAQRDLEALGFSMTDFAELVQSSVIYQSQYFRLDRTNPMGLFGYALMLEGVASSVGPVLYETVVRTHDKKAATFLDLHARADETHYPQGVAWLETFKPEEKESALENLRQSAVLYPAMLDAVRAVAMTQFTPVKKAA